MKERYSFVILVIISVLAAAIAVGISIHEIDVNNAKFCDLVRAVTSVPAPKPADAAANPSRERAYIDYQKFVQLGVRLGCLNTENKG